MELYKITDLLQCIGFEVEEALGKKSRIYYKYEGGSPSGSHKPNTAIPQAF
ncbi:MAG: hypothetical protein Ct9H90mP10_08460 [Actinomycetota bacterium]|nr:MAG: hypothetical protein Ct9H90mP10_08460 [Actinomycetota bacterium]